MVFSPSGHQNANNISEVWAMDIPNDLNKLLARLHEVTSNRRRTTETSESDPRPSAIEVDHFLSQYNFGSDATIEQLEISKEGAFEFYLFAVSNRLSDELSLLALWPQQNNQNYQAKTA
jgi:hypothetical protein